MVKFILNNQAVTATQADGSTVLDYIRYYKRLMGTKIGCREGDCGACTILVGDFENEALVYRSMTSCLMPLGNAQGKHIVSVEGINMKTLSPVQQALVDTNGTQCGFCTLGFVMSLTGFILSKENKTYEEAIASIDGNICRCTGYKSIERSAQLISTAMANKPEQATTAWLVSQGFLPDYFLTIQEQLTAIRADHVIFSGNGKNTPAMIVAGGTDLLVQKPRVVKTTDVQLVFDTKTIKGIRSEDGQCIMGGGVTVTEFLESPIIQEAFPSINKHIKLVSSTPIRNMATMAGNIANASPIGDMTIFFLALDAQLVLSKGEVQRTIALKDFYKGYKQTDKQTDEIISQLIFNLPTKETKFNFEKVSKRTNLDIASVNTACQLTMSGDAINNIHLSAGGVAPYPKYLSKTCGFLQGKKITANILEEALQLVTEETAPISDARGSAAYKGFLLRQLIIAHFLEFFGPTDEIKKLLSL